MAVPKKKRSRSATKTARTSWINRTAKAILKRTQFVVDKESGEPRLSHRADTITGKYNGKETKSTSKKVGTRIAA